VVTSAIAVLFGAALGRAVNPSYLRLAAGALFVIIGLWTLWSAAKGVC
jgi:putative Ca2+/H+ antiporter (TMEM165/GDT1 family)